MWWKPLNAVYFLVQLFKHSLYFVILNLNTGDLYKKLNIVTNKMKFKKKAFILIDF